MNTVMAWKMEMLREFVKNTRIGMNISIRGAASAIDISPTTLSKIEAGHIPDAKTMGKLLTWLGCEPAFYDIHINAK